ncbi:uncharacterized protein LOC115212034 [Argonauta hians]
MYSFEETSVHPNFCRLNSCNTSHLSYFDPCDCFQYHKCYSNGTAVKKTCNITTIFVMKGNLISSVQCLNLQPLRVKVCDRENPWALCNITKPFNKSECREIWPEDRVEWNPQAIEKFLTKRPDQNQKLNNSFSILVPIFLSLAILFFVILFAGICLLVRKHKNRSKTRNRADNGDSPDRGLHRNEQPPYEEIKPEILRKCSIDMLKRPLPDCPKDRDSNDVYYQRILSVYRDDESRKKIMSKHNIDTESIYIPKEGQYNVLQILTDSGNSEGQDTTK